ncbi:Hpt domain-containing protein [Maricaulis parjimensis]|uniref:Hpt domain-containing protein n=1 Tax=Maricaulis parjimensis TaxID=144023 RepID=UPI00193AC3B6|nr:Hpt domain-containing protein [Maricaulis parjimensis]
MKAQSSPQAETPLFDRAHLDRYTGGDEALTAELLNLMCDQARRCLGLMETASDETAWTAATHTLKGAARGVGAFALADLCEQAEAQPQMAWEPARLDVARCFKDTEAAFAGLI